MWNVSSPHILDSYNRSDIHENIYLWIEVWDNMFENKNNHYYYRIEPTNLRTALVQIIDDINVAIKLNKSINKIIKYLTEKFEYAISVDFISANIFSLEIKKYREILKKSYNNNNYFENDIKVFSSHILQKFNDGFYFNQLFNDLFKTIFSVESVSLKKLLSLNNFLLIELISKGFSFETVKELPLKLFSKNISTNLKERNNGKYYKTNLEYPLDDNASLEERFSFIKSLFNAPSYECDILCLVMGAKGEIENNIKIDEVEFINKLNIEYPWEDGKEEKLYVFNLIEKDLENSPFVRAKIRRKGIDLYKIIDDAFEVVSKTIDFLKYKYSSSERKNIELSKAWAALDLNGNIINQMPDFSHLGELPKHYEPSEVLSNYNDSVQITQEQGRIFGLNYNTLESNKIHVALEWLNKATMSSYSYDIYFMNLWIALEYLVKESNINILESVTNNLPALISNRFLYDILHNLHEIHFIQIHLKRMNIGNTELAQKIGLYPIEGNNIFKYHPIEYGKSISLITSWVKDSYVKKRSEEVANWFLNSKELVSVLKTLYNRNKYDFNIMYKIRNNIVHTADANNDYLGYYCIRLEETINLILEAVMHELQYNGEKKISEILGVQKILYDLNIENIKEGIYQI